MKLEQAPQDVILSDDFEQRDVAIGDIAFILDMFADKVYTHKERAVIRELACNAHDSHVIAGTQDIPFDVHLPTSLEPWFSLRDYGTGLEDHDIENIYGAIGVSTKRDSNEVIGCFGIGSLSPYSMCDSFTVKSYLNGTVRTYQCMRDSQRKPKVIPLGVEPTDEPNGLEVKLTVEGKVSTFEREAEQVFLFWEGTLPNINNKHVVEKCEYQRSQYVFKGDDFGLSSEWGENVAIMGNIAYEIPYELDEFRCKGYLKFELGELEFDTARESLSMTDKVKETIKAKFKSVKAKLKDIAMEQLEDMATPYSKAMLAESLDKGKLGQWIGRDELNSYMLPNPKKDVVFWSSRHRGCDKSSTQYVRTNHDGKVEYFIHKDRMTSRIRQWMTDKNSGHVMYIFDSIEQAQECNIPLDLIQDLDDLPKVQRHYNSNGVKQCKTLLFDAGVYKYASDKDHWDEHSLEIDGSEIVYVEVNRNKPVERSCYYTSSNNQLKSTISTAKDHGIDIKLVGLKTAFLNTAAFRKGNFIHIDDYLKREYAKIAPKTFFEYEPNDLSKFKIINEYIDNGDVRDIIQLADNCKNDGIAKVCKRLNIQINMTKDTMLQDLMDEFNDRYQMLKFVSSWEISNNAKTVASYIGGHVRNENN